MDIQCNVRPYNGEEKYIFISYSHRDKALVFPIIEQLVSDGYRIWYDEGIDPGTEWPEFIAEHLCACEVCIAFISSNSVASHNCRREINFAIEEKKTVIAVYLEELELTAGMRMQLNTLQAIHKYMLRSEREFYDRLYSAAGIEGCREEYPFGGVEGTIAPLPKEVPMSSSKWNEYATLKSALKTASERGIIELKVEDGKQYIVLGSYDMEGWSRERRKSCGDGWYKDGKKKTLLWEVIDYSAGTRSALVLCKNIVECRNYNEEHDYNLWEHSTLRKWLNGEFYETAFKAYERVLLAETEVLNATAHPGAKGGKDTLDRIFLLSLEEVDKYLPDESDRIRGTYDGSNSDWWLRTASTYDEESMFTIDMDGYIEDFHSVVGAFCGVCPAFWLKLDP